MTLKRPPDPDAARPAWGRLFNRARPAPEAPAAARAAVPPHVRMRQELQARLLVHDAASGLLVRNLYTVYRAMDDRGWSGIEQLAAGVVNLALAEAEILQEHEPSTVMGQLVDELRVLDEAARQRALEAAREEPADEAEGDELPSVAGVPEVTEISEEEYAFVERSWVGTIPDPDARRAVSTRQDLETLSLEFAPVAPSGGNLAGDTQPAA